MRIDEIARFECHLRVGPQCRLRFILVREVDARRQRELAEPDVVGHADIAGERRRERHFCARQVDGGAGEWVKHITERGLRVADVAERLGVSAHSLYAWVKRYSKPQVQLRQVDDQQAELRRLRAELKRVTEERDILKKAAAYFAKESG